MVIFSRPKRGEATHDWVDGAFAGPGAPAAAADPPGARFIVLDGGTEAYDVRRWVDQLAASFMAASAGGRSDRPAVDLAAMGAWLARMQDRWEATYPIPEDYFERRKFLEYGAFATLLAGELTGLHGPSPAWRAVALGDTVLFHVRHGRRLCTFPDLGPDDFGFLPDVAHTLRSSLGQMRERLDFREGTLADGDMIFVATDALAQWIISADLDARDGLWAALGSIRHPAAFARLIAAERAAGAMTDDDVTLLRITLAAEPPSAVAVCL